MVIQVFPFQQLYMWWNLLRYAQAPSPLDDCTVISSVSLSHCSDLYPVYGGAFQKFLPATNATFSVLPLVYSPKRVSKFSCWATRVSDKFSRDLASFSETATTLKLAHPNPVFKRLMVNPASVNLQWRGL